MDTRLSHNSCSIQWHFLDSEMFVTNTVQPLYWILCTMKVYINIHKLWDQNFDLILKYTKIQPIWSFFQKHPEKMRFAVAGIWIKRISLTWESIAVVSWQSVHDVLGMRGPGSNLPVPLDSVHQLGSSILQGNRVTMGFIQLLQHSTKNRNCKVNNYTCWVHEYKYMYWLSRIQYTKQ